MYGKLENNNLIFAPINYVTSEGNFIANFTKSEELMMKYGFKLIVEVKPIYDETKQYLSVSGYNETDKNITINYVINELPIVNKTQFEILQETVDAIVLSSLGV